MTKSTLSFSCLDRPGIVVAVSSWILSLKGNILESAQHTEEENGHFFMRVLFETPSSIPAGSFHPIAAQFGMDWRLQNKDHRPKTLLMVSKFSHCLTHILQRISTGALPIEATLIVSNHTDLEPIASFYGIPFHHLPITAETKIAQENHLQTLAHSHGIELIVLARYMQILSPALCAHYRGKVINIHHSFLPSFKGAKPYHQAFERGVKLIGATAHYVTSDLDEGPIIEQETVRVSHAHSPEELVFLGNDIESLVLTRAIKYHAEGRTLLYGNKTVVFN